MSAPLHPQTMDDLADDVLRHISKYRSLLAAGRVVRSLTFTVKFKGTDMRVRDRFWTIESAPKSEGG